MHTCHSVVILSLGVDNMCKQQNIDSIQVIQLRDQSTAVERYCKIAESNRNYWNGENFATATSSHLTDVLVEEHG